MALFMFRSSHSFNRSPGQAVPSLTCRLGFARVHQEPSKPAARLEWDVPVCRSLLTQPDIQGMGAGSVVQGVGAGSVVQSM